MKRTHKYIYERGSWRIVQLEKFEPAHVVVIDYYKNGEKVETFYSRFVAPRWHLDAFIDRMEVAS